MLENDFSFQNKEDIKKWYLGIQTIFRHIMSQKKWTKKEAWDHLEIELRKSVPKKDFITDDLEWVKGLLFYGKKFSIKEALRVSRRYSEATPLIDSLAKLL